ncbi:hypothetical protein CR513_05676, partial [Mucuna pruriens]
MVNEIGAIDNLRLDNQLTELTSLVRQLAIGQHQPNIVARVYGICTSVEHPTDMCPTLQETESDQSESVGAIGEYQYGKQSYQSRPFDNQQFGKQPFRPRPSQGPYAAQRFESAPNVPQRPTEYERHYLVPQDANWIASQYCEPITVSWIQQLTLTNNSESEREWKCTYLEKWKGITSTSTATVAEINRAHSEPDISS